MRSMPNPLCPLRHFHVADLKHGNHSFDSSNRRMRYLEVMKPEEQYKIPNKIPNKIPKKIPKKIHTHKEAPRPKERGAGVRLNTNCKFFS